MDIEDKELKSEEIQEILSRPPHALIRWGITVFFMVISFLFIGGCFFSYPDTVEAGITITTENPPAWIVARSTGKLKEVFLKDKQKVKAGELIGVVNNPADTREVLLLKKELEAFQINDSMICQGHFTGRLTLGEIQSAYTGFIKSLTEYRDFLKLDLYKEKEEAARRELNEYQIYISHLHNEVNLNKEELKLALSSYSREEILYKKGLVSASDYEKEQQAYLASKRGTEQMQTTLSSARIQEAKLHQTIVEIQLEQNQKANSLQVVLQTAYDQLQVSINNWKLAYLFTAPTDGILSYNEVWQKNQNITAGDKVFSVVAENSGAVIGKAKLPVSNSGKVKSGQWVNIRLTGYPYMEYGFLTGKVSSISLLSNEDSYTVTVELPDTLQTSYNHILEFQGELSGSAEVLTDERSFTARLLGPLRYLWEKYSL